MILGIRYINYKNALKILDLQSLEDRRKFLCLKFAKNSLKNEKVKHLFPEKKKHDYETRFEEKYEVNTAKTKRYKHSAIPYMQMLLNQDQQVN